MSSMGTGGPLLFSAGRDRVFGENLLDPLERLLGGSLRCHAALDDVHPALAPGVLARDLRVSRVEGPELRHGRAEQALRRVGCSVRIVEPPMVLLHDRGHARNAATKTGFQP